MRSWCSRWASIRRSSSARNSASRTCFQTTSAQRQTMMLTTMPASSARQTASKRSALLIRFSAKTSTKAAKAARVRARRMPAFARGCWAIETMTGAGSPLSFLSFLSSFSLAISAPPCCAQGLNLALADEAHEAIFVGTGDPVQANALLVLLGALAHDDAGHAQRRPVRQAELHAHAEAERQVPRI